MNGAGYIAVDVVLDRVHPGHRVNADTILHFVAPAGILLAYQYANTVPKEAGMATDGHHSQGIAMRGRVRLHGL